MAADAGAQGTAPTMGPFKRVRPGDADWPSEARWQELNAKVGGQLTRVTSPLDACKGADKAACDAVFKGFKNPYFIRDNVALTQTTGWSGAWTSSPSAYAIDARNAADVAAAVNFARDNKLRLVVRGGGHSYLGTSNAPDSLLVRTRLLDQIVMHDAFVAQGCSDAAQPAVSLGAGNIWLKAYAAVTKAGRYVQGGGCCTVNVAGLIQGGGFGSFSKRFGLAAASLLEAEVVTADGQVRIVNACKDPDLYWALKGGGGCSFGVVTRVTLKTHELPAFLGAAFGAIKAQSDEAFKRLVARFMTFYRESLFNPTWGEQVKFQILEHDLTPS
jgi:FAD/FMN-containing dehydrogenase